MVSYRSLECFERNELEAGLRFAKQFLGSDNFRDIHLIQRAYDAALDSGNVSTESARLIGYAFGQHLIETANWLSWRMLCDPEYGDEISVAVDDRNLGCSPLSMIRHRLEDRERSDLLYLQMNTVDRLRKLGQSAASN